MTTDRNSHQRIFAKFGRTWEFDHYTISPRHSQANGKVESAVRTAKGVLQKCAHSKTDPYLAILELRNTPTQGVESSPAQRLHGRRTRTMLPTTAKLLKPRCAEILTAERKKMKRVQNKQEMYFNRHAKDLTTLQEGDIVRLKPCRQGSKFWQKAIVQRRLYERSYEVETDTGLILRRNRVDLRRTDEPPPPLQHGTNLKDKPKPTVETRCQDRCVLHHTDRQHKETKQILQQHDIHKTQTLKKTPDNRILTQGHALAGQSNRHKRYGDYVE